MFGNNRTKQPILFILSVDTEEEWDWSTPFPQEHFNINNIQQLTGFQKICDDIGIRPTYFVDYAVVDSTEAVDIIKPAVQDDRCEIGAHLHPWCNPPYYGYIGEKESHVINLPIEQVEQKLLTLVQRLKKEFGVYPQSFRTGRWGIDNKVLQLLTKHGFTVDSSIYPFYQNEFFSCVGSPTQPYWPDLTNPLQQHSQRLIYELPVTTGFNHNCFTACEKIYRLFSFRWFQWLRLIGIAWQTHLLRKIYLSPELNNSEEMLKLCNVVIQMGYPVLHMYMHSSSLVDNTNSLVGNKNAYQYITTAIKDVVTELKRHHDIQFCTISEAARLLQKREFQ